MTKRERDWVAQSSGQDRVDETADGVNSHTDEGPRQHHVPAAGRSRREIRRAPVAGPRRHGHGVASDVPDYPEPLPGSDHHIAHEAHEVSPPPLLDVGPAKPAYSGMMAHGVEPTVHYGGRPAPTPEQRTEHEASRKRQAAPQAAPARQSPVPVYLVDVGSGSEPLKRMATKNLTVKGLGNRPERIAGRDPHRSVLRLLNEDPTNGVRILAEATDEIGALLPAAMTSYQEFGSQDDIYAIGNTASSVVLSVIIEYDVPGGA